MTYNYGGKSFVLERNYNVLYVKYSVTLLGGLLAWHNRFAINKSDKVSDNNDGDDLCSDSRRLDDIYQKYFSEDRLKVHSDIENERKRVKDRQKHLNRVESGYYKKLYIIGSVFLVLGALLLTFGLWLVNSSESNDLNYTNSDDGYQSGIILDSSLEGSDL